MMAASGPFSGVFGARNRALIAQLSDDSRSKMRILLDNIAKAPDDPRFRTLRTTNRSMSKLLGQPGVLPVLELAGFCRAEADADRLTCPPESPLERLREVLRAAPR